MLINSKNWFVVYQQKVKDIDNPISPIIINTPFAFPIIDVQVLCPNAPKTWKVGGWLYQHLQPPSSVNKEDLQVLSKNICWLNRVTVHHFPEIADNYYLSFEVPRWFIETYVRIRVSK